MKKQLNPANKKRQASISYVPEYNEDFQVVFRILDTDGMYPFYVQDPEAGRYKIIKTTKGNLQMVK